MCRTELLTLCFLTMLGLNYGNAFGQETAFKSRKAREAVAKYEAETQKLDVEFKSKRGEFLEQLLASLELAQEDATKQGQLDEALLIRSELSRLKASKDQRPAERAGDRISPEMRLARELPGSAWINEEGRTFRFLADSTIKASWHDEPTLWCVTGANEAKAVFAKNRFVAVLRIDAARQIIHDGTMVWRRIRD